MALPEAHQAQPLRLATSDRSTGQPASRRAISGAGERLSPSTTQCAGEGTGPPALASCRIKLQPSTFQTLPEMPQILPMPQPRQHLALARTYLSWPLP
jgi:hypothetical protein